MQNSLNIAKGITATGIGFVTTNPNAPIFDSLHTALNSALPSSMDADTILKTIVGLLIAVISNFLYKWIDNKFLSKKEK